MRTFPLAVCYWAPKRRRPRDGEREFRWRDQFNLSLAPDTAEQYHDQNLPEEVAEAEKGMEEMSRRYREGGDLYVPE
jgi:hypothetical protein